MGCGACPKKYNKEYLLVSDWLAYGAVISRIFEVCKVWITEKNLQAGLYV
jgi:hypothetical protein